jgi:hypothetical protein
MLMPAKHIGFSQSLLGFGGFLLAKLETPKSIDHLWEAYLSDFKKGVISARHSFDNLVLTVIFLHAIEAVKEENGEVMKCD